MKQGWRKLSNLDKHRKSHSTKVMLRTFQQLWVSRLPGCRRPWTSPHNGRNLPSVGAPLCYRSDTNRDGQQEQLMRQKDRNFVDTSWPPPGLTGWRMVPSMIWLGQLSRMIWTSLCRRRDSVKNLASAANASGVSEPSASRLNVGHWREGKLSLK